MERQRTRGALLVGLAVMAVLVGLVGLGGVAVGRWWAANGAKDPRGGYDQGYRAGLDAGQAQGIEQGRALELGQSVAPAGRSGVQAAFRAGYAAGANDVFGTYDGGWELGRPYLVVLGHGNDGATYRIERREPVPARCLPPS